MDGMKLHREKYSEDFTPELFQGSEKLVKIIWM
jgi:hypothetical protein